MLGAVVAALIAAAPSVAPAQAARPDAPPVGEAAPPRSALQRADSCWAAGDHPAARAAYADAVRADSTQSRAVFRLATLLAWSGRPGEALPLFRRYRRLEPRDAEGALAEARAHAWGGRHAEAVALDDSVAAADPANRAAALDAAQALAWAGRAPAAVARYRAWLAAHPDDRDAELALARTLAWGGRLAEAARVYDRLADAGSVEAAKGRARVAAWRGDLARSRSLWEALGRAHALDPEVWVGLAQAQRGLGRPREADAALRQALRLEPGHRDAVEQRRWVRSELATTLAPAVVYGTDSDRNTSLLTTVQAALPPWAGARVSVHASTREARFGAVDARARAARGVLAWVPRPGLAVRAEAGATGAVARRAGAATARRVRPVVAAGLAAPLPGGAAVEVGLSRAPFDDTAPLIERGIVATAADVALEVPLGGILSASLSGGRTALAGGSVPNVRTGGAASLRWRVGRRVSLAAGQRGFGYARSPGDGYFAPRRLTLAEVSARAAAGGERGWHAEAELGVGRQVVRTAGARSARAAERGTLTLGWRPAPGVDVGLTAGAANVASPTAAGTGGSAYQAWSTGLRVRLPLP